MNYVIKEVQKVQPERIRRYEGTKEKYKLKLVNALWTTPIVIVLIILLALVSWIPSTVKFTLGIILIISHLYQYIQSVAYWKKESTSRL